MREVRPKKSFGITRLEIDFRTSAQSVRLETIPSITIASVGGRFWEGIRFFLEDANDIPLSFDHFEILRITTIAVSQRSPKGIQQRFLIVKFKGKTPNRN